MRREQALYDMEWWHVQAVHNPDRVTPELPSTNGEEDPTQYLVPNEVHEVATVTSNVAPAEVDIYTTQEEIALFNPHGDRS